jgi:hypothetical protein
MTLNLVHEYLSPDQREHLKHAGYVCVRVDHSLADRVGFASGVDYETVTRVLDALRDITR